MSNKVLIISYYWPPSGGAGVQRWLKFAKYLPEFGWEPIVLTVDEKYASYPQKDLSLVKEAEAIKTFKTKSFEVYNLYSSIKKDKQIPYGGFSNENEPNLVQKISRFIRGNFFIPDPRKGWNRYAYKEAVKLISQHSINTIITTSPPHSTQLIGLKLKKNFPHLKWISDLRDPWTDIYYYKKFYPTKIASSIDKKCEELVIKRADKIITVSASIKTMLENRYNVPNKIELISNGYDADDFPESMFSTIEKQDEILYTGTITDEYPLKEVVEIAKNNPKFKFRFIGNSTQNFVDLITTEKLEDQFIFEKPIPHSEIVKEMVRAKMLLLLIPKIEQNHGILTGKLFEYIGSRTPILAIGPKNGDAGKIIEETESGVYYSYEELTNFNSKNITQKQAKSFSFNLYSRKQLANNIAEILNQK